MAPDTSYLAGPAPAEATTLYADLDLGRITQGHLALDVDGHYARPDIFQLMVNDHPQPNVRFASDAGTGVVVGKRWRPVSDALPRSENAILSFIPDGGPDRRLPW